MVTLKIPCVWLTDGSHETEWESSWLQELFGDTWNDLEHIHDGALQRKPITIPFRMPIIFILNMKTVERRGQVATYIKQYHEANVPFGVIHLSDEFYMSDYSIYRYPQCQWIWRNYWHPVLQELSKVRYFGLGYKKDFVATTTNADVPLPPIRLHTWCFAGELKNRHPDRMTCLKVFQEIPGGHCVIEEGNSFSNPITGLNTAEYRRMLTNSYFALCPPGNVNMDSFRIYEALEAGAVPVVTKSTPQQSYLPCYWAHVFEVSEKEIPFVMEDTWEACAKKVWQYLHRSDEYAKMQTRCQEFWQTYKKKLQTKMQKDVTNLKESMR